MRVSGKITHSFYCFLRLRGFDVSRFFELTTMEVEFLKDPSSWLNISKVEKLLKALSDEYSPHFVDKDFISCVGQACFEMAAWGELDSVLKMKRPQPVFSNLPVFLSYFISEGFSLIDIKKERGFLSYKASLSSEEYPFITEYLRTVLEALPLYTGQPKAEAKWIRDYIQIQWEENLNEQQGSFFGDGLEVNLKPEILSDFRQFLEKVEKELYNNRQIILEKDRKISVLKDQLLLHGVALPDETEARIQQIEQELLSIQSALSSIKTGSREQEGSVVMDTLPEQLDSVLDSLQALKELLIK